MKQQNVISTYGIPSRRLPYLLTANGKQSSAITSICKMVHVMSRANGFYLYFDMHLDFIQCNIESVLFDIQKEYELEIEMSLKVCVEKHRNASRSKNRNLEL